MDVPCSVATSVRMLVAAGISTATTSSACPIHVVEHAASVIVMHRTSANAPRSKRLLFFIVSPFSRILKFSLELVNVQTHTTCETPTPKPKYLSPALSAGLWIDL